MTVQELVSLFQRAGCTGLETVVVNAERGCAQEITTVSRVTGQNCIGLEVGRAVEPEVEETSELFPDPDPVE